MAAEFGCRVTGVDLTEAYVHIARSFTERVGLADRVSFRVADATDLPFEDDGFDVAWMQHTSMNVEDKGRLFDELRRVLRPGGRLAFYEICAGRDGELYFPVPWADDRSISFLVSPERMRTLLVDRGFAVRVWKDVTAESTAWLREATEPAPRRLAAVPTVRGHNVLMSEAAAEPLGNLLRNLEAGYVRVVMAVLENPSNS